MSNNKNLNKKQIDEPIVCGLKVDGMHCASCELLVESELSKLGAKDININLKDNLVQYKTVDDKTRDIINTNLAKHINKLGYTVHEYEYIPADIKSNKFISYPNFNLDNMLIAAIFALVIFILFKTLENSGVILIPNLSTNITFKETFTLGMIASLSTCGALVTSMVLSISSNTKGENHKLNVKQMLSFHISRFLAFLAFGAILGSISGFINFSNDIKNWISLVLSIIMILTALKLIGVYLNFPIDNPLSKLSKKFNVLNKEGSILISIILGISTFFLPCGFTQQSQFYALNSGSAINGMILLGSFALGTLPFLIAVSLGADKLSQSKYKNMVLQIIGFLIIYLSLDSLPGILRLLSIIR